VFLDQSQNFYIADLSNSVIRKVTLNNPETITVSAVNITVPAGSSSGLSVAGLISGFTSAVSQTASQIEALLMASYSAPGLTGVQLAAEFSNCELGFTVTGPGFSQNIPLFS
jgi:hypothetical protein